MPGNELTQDELDLILAQSAWKPADPLVYFNPDTGELTMLTGELQDDNPNFIRVNPAEIDDLIKNKTSPGDYRVVMDYKTNEYILQNILDGDVRSFNWNDEVYQIPNTGTASINLLQKTKEKTWTLELSDQVRASLSKQTVHAKSNLAFYATKKDDVNVLYGILKFRMIDITTSGKFTIEHDSAGYECSVFCRRIFDSYRHIEQ